MVSQKQSGKAFEFAMVQALQEKLGKSCNPIESKALAGAATDFSLQEKTRQKEDLLAASAAVGVLFQSEPYLHSALQGDLQLEMSLQLDRAGAAGDVRDLVLRHPETGWEIGISAKHQHEALKHSRLSNQIDFGFKWFGLPCTPDYFSEIAPVFEHLYLCKARGIAWSQIDDKEASIYVPILKAFQREVMNLDRLNPGVVARGLASYLIGVFDFYKVVKLKNETKVQVFNFNGTLNQPVKGIQSKAKLEKLKLPTRIVELDFRRKDNLASNTTLDMICDNGWQLSFRLHNASTLVEPSLKFDINLEGRPNNLQTFSAIW
ncbi:MAG: HaeIII family restriction endonuclease [Cyanobacteria bacterium DS2.3.42]|nr:HaeIII family restriction endonuclease [Cyanobacteria bacterium DS2.3.42]